MNHGRGRVGRKTPNSICAPSGGGQGAWRSCGDREKDIQSLVEARGGVCGFPADAGAQRAPGAQARPWFRPLRCCPGGGAPGPNPMHKLDSCGGAEWRPPRVPQREEAVSEPGRSLERSRPFHGKGPPQEARYNQLSWTACPLALAPEMAPAPDALKRVRETRSQAGLTNSAPARTPVELSCGGRRRVNGRAVLAVEAVATMGTTVSSCAGVLQAAAAQDFFRGDGIPCAGSLWIEQRLTRR